MLLSPVSHPWPGGVAWYYGLGAHRWLGPPFRRLVPCPRAWLMMRGAVAGVFAPNPRPRDFIEATGLPLVLRPLHFRANCEDVAHAEAAVAAMSPRYGEIRAPTEVVTGDSDGVVYAHIHSAGLARDIPGARLTTLAGRRPLAPLRRAGPDRRDHPRGRGARQEPARRRTPEVPKRGPLKLDRGPFGPASVTVRSAFGACSAAENRPLFNRVSCVFRALRRSFGKKIPASESLGRRSFGLSKKILS